MFVLVFAVPALVVVVTGYALGYALAEWVCGLQGTDATRTPEVVGWTTGLLLLALVVWLGVTGWRRRGRKRRRLEGSGGEWAGIDGRGIEGRGHQK